MLGSMKKLGGMAIASVILGIAAQANAAVEIEYYTVGTFSGGAGVASNGAPTSPSVSTDTISGAVLTFTGQVTKDILTDELYAPGDLDAPLHLGPSVDYFALLGFGSFSWSGITATPANFSTTDFDLSIYQVDPRSGNDTLLGQLTGKIVINGQGVALSLSSSTTVIPNSPPNVAYYIYPNGPAGINIPVTGADITGEGDLGTIVGDNPARSPPWRTWAFRCSAYSVSDWLVAEFLGAAS